MSIVSLAVVVLTTCGYVLLCLLSSKYNYILIDIIDCGYVTIILHAAPRDNCTKGSDHTTGNIQDTYNVIDSQYTLSSNVAEVNYFCAALCCFQNVFFITSGIHIMPWLVNMKMQQLLLNDLASLFNMPTVYTSFADRNFECMHLDTQIIT